ncbi:amphi-Trp domain-containing protein [Natrialba asiatica]|uniref:DUF1508 domain-containing protein n=1 Tax=Natrialba asiatica (strain ATCC 700177 / DSM 12278 / JCM 9576 / FERM P-10747 / NBRC 102637 / 172P1) TaxID=29540 RepID=M0AKS4_NATA1|nr:amphi-Trp domain-containing protein [Natrialba asiatica]ELY99330.1 hypothetical protein C481_15805 [Natrialba asiatica DSM 12278]
MDDSPTDAAFEHEHETTVDRGELGALFRDLAVAIEDERPIHLLGDDRTVSVTIPSQVDLELEAEREPTDADEGDEDDEDEATDTADVDRPATVEFEIELEWDEEDETARIVDDTDVDASGSDPVMLSPGVDAGTDAVDDAAEMDGSAGESAEGAGETDAQFGRTSRFEVYQDRADEWRWRLVHWNGNILADSGEGYTSRANAKRAVHGVRQAVPAATVADQDGGPD